jgi:hypothetical protein
VTGLLRKGGGAFETAGGDVSAPPSLSGPGGIERAPSPLNLVRLEPRALAAASPSVERTSGPGTGLPSTVPSSLTALWECRRAWSRVQQQLELEVWPA